MRRSFYIIQVFIISIIFVQQLHAKEITKKIDVVRGQDYIENIYYLGEEEIAREKETKDGIVEQTGFIPDGKIKFVNDYQKTYGEENYRFGKKHGISKSYFQDGTLHMESEYEDGQMLWSKEYFTQGHLRYEVNFKDARLEPIKNENGIGKIYHLNGRLKYEWNVTKSRQRAYKKSYNRIGTLMYEAYFDSRGKLIKETSHNRGQ